VKVQRTALAAQIKAVLTELGLKENTEIKEVVDETIIGGFVATFDYKEHDRSYKKALKSLYESITK
jgi:F0F1-type ATP synthase delta subunit